MRPPTRTLRPSLNLLKMTILRRSELGDGKSDFWKFMHVFKLKCGAKKCAITIIPDIYIFRAPVREKNQKIQFFYRDFELKKLGDFTWIMIFCQFLDMLFLIHNRNFLWSSF